jgi:hypothetical protein
MDFMTTVLRQLVLAIALVISLQGFSQHGDIAINTKQYTVPANEEKEIFSVFPASVQKAARLTIDAPYEGWATFELRDKCGDVVLEQQMGVNKGINTIPVFFISKLEKGTYTSVLKLEDKIYFSKLVKE